MPELRIGAPFPVAQAFATNLRRAIHAVREQEIRRSLKHEERRVSAALGVASVAEEADMVAVADGQHGIVALVFRSEETDAFRAAQLARHLLHAELIETQWA